MTEMPRFRVLDAVFFLIVLAIAAGARVWYLTNCLQSLTSPPPLAVQDPAPFVALADESKNLSLTLQEYSWDSSLAPLSDAKERTAYTAPGYLWLLERLARIASDSAQTVEWLRWGQCGLGTLTAALYFLFARRAFRSSLAGFLAGLLCSLHPFWIINTAEIADGVLVSFLVAGALFLGARGVQEGDVLCSLLFGFALAGLALVRAALLPFAAVACLGFLLGCSRTMRGWLCALLAFLALGNSLAPWTVRNWLAFHEIVPIADSMYLHLWKGINDKATGGPQDEPTLRSTLPPGQLRQLMDELNQAKRYNMLAHEVLDQLTGKPEQVIHLRFRALGCFLFGESWLQGDGLARSESAASLPPEVAACTPLALEAMLLGMLLLALLGWRWSYGWRRESMPMALAVVWIPLPYLLSHAETYSGPRLPLDGVLLCYCAFALLCLVGLGAKLLRGASA